MYNKSAKRGREECEVDSWKVSCLVSLFLTTATGGHRQHQATQLTTTESIDLDPWHSPVPYRTYLSLVSDIIAGNVVGHL